MKYFLRLFFIFLIGINLVYAQQNTDNSVFNLFPKKIDNKKAKKDSGFDFIPNQKQDNSGFVPNNQKNTILKPSPFQNSNSNQHEKPITKSLFASYIDLPNKAYVGQLIPIRIKLVIARKFETIKFSSLSNEDGQVIDYLTDLIHDENSKNVYFKNILFKANKPLDQLPPLYIELINKNEIEESISLPSHKISIISLNDDEERFINVFAKKLEIKKFKTNTFDDKNLIMVMEINAQNSNIEDIKFKNVQKQGIDTKSGDYENNTIFYFIIFPKERQKIQMSYFDTGKNKFQIINLPVEIEQEDLSTQIDLNPKKSKFELYKELALIGIVLIFLLLFIIKKKYFYALIAIALSLYLVYTKFSPKNDINIKQNTKVRILPTEKSTIFHTTTKIEHVEKLNQINSYVKILLPNKKIGWIKDEDIIKN